MVGGSNEGRHILFVVNRRFVPDNSSSGYIYGVVQHSLHLADLLSRSGWEVSFVLYQRDDELKQCMVDDWQVGSFRAVVVAFNFLLPESQVALAFSRAVARLTESPSDVAGPSPLVYLQTDVLLPYMPSSVNLVLTHHAPFVEDVREKIGQEAAERAFGWDHPKAEFLLRMQGRSVGMLAHGLDVLCLEISCLQERFLLRRGVPSEAVGRLPPPVGGAGVHGRLPEAIRTVLGERGGYTAITAVSRLDYFKRIELFVEGCRLALERNALDAAIVIGGDDVDENRPRLESLIPSVLRDRFVFLPRQDRDVLVGAIFPSLQGRGLFVCTSRYDLVPYTVLEAARAGLWTVVPNTGTVGAAEYLPQDYQFVPTIEGVATSVEQFRAQPEGPGAFSHLARIIAHATSDEAVLSAFESATSSLRLHTSRCRDASTLPRHRQIDSAKSSVLDSVRCGHIEKR